MIGKLEFGVCLKHILIILNINMNQLSKAINVDSSLVSRWINGKRIPATPSPHINNIAKFLSGKVCNSFQMQCLDELFKKVFNQNSGAMDIKEKIRLLLLEAQGHSYEQRIRNIKRVSASDQNSNLFKSDILNIAKCESRKDNVMHRSGNIIESISLSSDDKVISGTESILSTSLQLLDDVVKLENINENTVRIFFNMDTELDNLTNFESSHWCRKLYSILDKGCNVYLVINLNKNIEKTIKLINFTKPLITYKNFYLYYLKKYDVVSTGAELITASHIGAMLCLPNGSHFQSNVALFFRNTFALDALENYFNAIFQNYASPVVTYYLEDNNIIYSKLLNKLEEHIGNRYFFRHDFGTLLIPEELYKNLLIRKNFSDEEVQLSMKFYRKRFKGFFANLRNYTYIDIYSAKCMNRLINNKKYYLYSYKGAETVDINTQDVIDILQNIIEILKQYGNYNMAFSPKQAYSELYSSNFLCTVKESTAVLLEAYSGEKSTPEIRLSIDEPILVKAYEELLTEIYHSISPMKKDKEEIIKYLNKQIRILNESAKAFC